MDHTIDIDGIDDFIAIEMYRFHSVRDAIDRLLPWKDIDSPIITSTLPGSPKKHRSVTIAGHKAAVGSVLYHTPGDQPAMRRGFESFFCELNGHNYDFVSDKSLRAVRSPFMDLNRTKRNSGSSG